MSTAADTLDFSLTARAAQRVAQLIRQEGDARLMLRVSVSGGGRSGFQYGFSFDDTVNPDARTFPPDGVTAVVAEAPLGRLAAAPGAFAPPRKSRREGNRGQL